MLTLFFVRIPRNADSTQQGWIWFQGLQIIFERARALK